MPSRADENLDQTFTDLYEVIRSSRFLERRGLGNELPFFISAYHPSREAEVDSLTVTLATRLSNHGVSVLWLNLYDVIVEHLQARGVWQRLLEREPKILKDQLLQTLLNFTSPKDQLVPLVASKLAAAPIQVLQLTSVGLVFPYLRSHSVLGNLQSVTQQIPTVLFFPGDYSFEAGKGSYLKLFGVLPDVQRAGRSGRNSPPSLGLSDGGTERRGSKTRF